RQSRIRPAHAGTDARGGDAGARFRSAQGQTLHPLLLRGRGRGDARSGGADHNMAQIVTARAGGIMSEVLVLRRARPPAIVPPLLSFTAGFIDSFTVLALFGLFVAQVTGSFVLTAVAIVPNEQGSLTKVLAIPGFLLAAATTTVVAVMLERRGRAALAWVLGLECAVLTGLLLTALIGAPLARPNAATVVAASLLG